MEGGGTVNQQNYSQGVRYNFQSQDANEIMASSNKDEETKDKDDLNDTTLKDAGATK